MELPYITYFLKNILKFQMFLKTLRNYRLNPQMAEVIIRKVGNSVEMIKRLVPAFIKALKHYLYLVANQC